MEVSARIKIDSGSSTPIYRQISKSIKELIYEGDLGPGQFLPSERVLAQDLGVARGTVKKAYEELSRQDLVAANVGKGTQVKSSYSKSDNQVVEMDQLLNSLLESNYSEQEIEAMIKGRLKYKSDKPTVNIAALDCNWEALNIVNRQIRKFPMDIDITDFLISNVLSYKSALKTFSGYDMIITTSNHYQELMPVLEDCQDKLVKIALAPDRDTVMAITLLKNELGEDQDSIGVFSRTQRFRDIVTMNLQTFSLEIRDSQCLFQEDSLSEIDDFLKGKKAIVMPPFYAMSLSNHVINSLYEFKNRGGTIIIFNYTVEQGSLLHIEEKIKRIVSGRMNNG